MYVCVFVFMLLPEPVGQNTSECPRQTRFHVHHWIVL